MKKFFAPLLTAGTLLTLLYTVYGYREQNEKLKAACPTSDSTMKEVIVAPDVAQHIIDSLQDEMFNAQNINGRYELSLEHLREVNPKAAKQFEDYMSHETE
jgi:predicted nucleic acid-binding protein